MKPAIMADVVEALRWDVFIDHHLIDARNTVGVLSS
jgi:hypothetical protein